MNLQKVKLIWQREMRDQFRDRRTLFMVAILPVLMYPLLGTVFFQLAQFMQQHTGVVVVVGADQLEELEGPKLFEEESFSSALNYENAPFELRFVKELNPEADEEYEQELAEGVIDVLVEFPNGFAEQLNEIRNQLDSPGNDETATESTTPTIPKPTVRYNSAREQSGITHQRIGRILSFWEDQLVDRNLSISQVPSVATKPFQVNHQDVAKPENRDARLWSKILPFVVFIWALTGAFYPAIDLCAGEKERGTLETLLASPAERIEIVVGKLLTVMTFSIFTALLNLLSLMLTARMVITQLGSIFGGGADAVAPPSLAALGWLVLALIPMSALFGALSLACASFARSTKEGQYYFMPLFLAAMPLMMMPMSPGIELNLGNSLIPIMGIVLLLRAVIEGQFLTASTYFLPATFTTGVCCWLATRWAVTQFNHESVLFRESEHFSLIGWLRSALRHRGPTVSAGWSIALVVAIFIIRFFINMGMAGWQPEGEITFNLFRFTMVMSQLLPIAIPTLLIVGFFSTNWRSALMLDSEPWWRGIISAVLIALCLAPAGGWLTLAIQQAYPIGQQLEQELQSLGWLLSMSPSIYELLFWMALVPAICEEIAFRGVILQGLRKPLGKVGAILISAVLFGAVHTVIQQSLSATVLGIVIGILAIRSRNLLACMAFHAVYNASNILFSQYQENLRGLEGVAGLLWTEIGEFEGNPLCFRPEVAILGVLAALVILALQKPGKSG